MIFARGSGGMIHATPGADAICPMCHESLIPKCGDIVQWHWAHRSATDCDSWYEPESEWHKDWKEFFADQGGLLEVPMERNGERHRADVVLPKIGNHRETIVELQATYLPPAKIREREAFYGPALIWIYRMDAFARRIVLGRTLSNGAVGFRIKAGPLSIGEHRRPVYFDAGGVDGCGCGLWRARMDVRESYYGSRRIIGSVYHVQNISGVEVGERGCDCLKLRYPFDDSRSELEPRCDHFLPIRAGIIE